MKIRMAVVVGSTVALAASAHAQPYRATPIPAGQRLPIINPPTDGPGMDFSWNTVDGGGGQVSGGGYNLNGTVGQCDAGIMSGGGLELIGGFWGMSDDAAVCYVNCDGSTVTPLLTANDFQCFMNAYAAQAPYANCDGSTITPLLTANDFQCFLNAYAAGCS